MPLEGARGCGAGAPRGHLGSVPLEGLRKCVSRGFKKCATRALISSSGTQNCGVLGTFFHRQRLEGGFMAMYKFSRVSYLFLSFNMPVQR